MRQLGKLATAVAATVGTYAWLYFLTVRRTWDSSASIPRMLVIAALVVGVLASIVSLLTAAYHWWTDSERKWLWALALLGLSILGAWCYWIVGPGDIPSTANEGV